MKPTTTRKLLGAKIKELRKSKGYSQDQLSEKIDIDTKSLSRIEVGSSYPSLDLLDRISKALGVEIKDFFEFVHESKIKDLRGAIINLLDTADQDKLKLIVKIIRAIVR